MNELYCCGCGKPLEGQPALVENNPDMCVCETCLGEIRKLMSSSQHSAAATYFVEKRKEGYLTDELMAFLSDSDRIRAYVSNPGSQGAAQQSSERADTYARQTTEEFGQRVKPTTPEDCAKAILEDPGYCMSVSGQRIQNAATIITVIEVVAVFIVMIALMASEMIVPGLIVLVVGLLSAWLVYIFLNGFAKLVDNSCISAAQSLKATQKQ